MWCHERCHKAEEQAMRQMIASIGIHCGFELECLKKAQTFKTWLGDVPQNEYVLLTDGRELKPCMEALSSEMHRPPQFIVVMASRAKHARRIASWIEDHVRVNVGRPVCVIRACEELEAILAGLDSPASSLSQGVFNDRPVGARGYARSSQETAPSGSQSEAVVPPIPARDARSSREYAWTDASPFGFMPWHWLHVPFLPVSYALWSPDAQPIGAPDLSAAIGGGDEVVSAVLSGAVAGSIVTGADASRVEALLREVAPRVYED